MLGGGHGKRVTGILHDCFGKDLVGNSLSSRLNMLFFASISFDKSPLVVWADCVR